MNLDRSTANLSRIFKSLNNRLYYETFSITNNIQLKLRLYYETNNISIFNNNFLLIKKASAIFCEQSIKYFIKTNMIIMD